MAQNEVGENDTRLDTDVLFSDCYLWAGGKGCCSHTGRTGPTSWSGTTTLTIGLVTGLHLE